jgi:hypothetical protein
MKSSIVIPRDEQDHFWSVIRTCIRRFHPDSASRALAAATRLRMKVTGMPIEQLELFYHAEPFDVACNLAGNSLDVKECLDEYLAIREAPRESGRSKQRKRGVA